MSLAAGILFWFLNLNPVKQKSWKQHAKELDYIGIVLIIGGIVMFLLGLVQGEEGNWSEPQTIALLTVGLCSLVGAAVNEYVSSIVLFGCWLSVCEQNLHQTSPDHITSSFQD